MNEKIQEIVSDLSLWYLATEEELKPFDLNAGPCYIIEKSYVIFMINFMRDQDKEIERLRAENQQLRQAIADARHLASYHGTTEDIYNRLTKDRI